MFRRGRHRCFAKLIFLKICKVHRKHLCRSLFYVMLQAQMFSGEFYLNFKNTFFTEHLQATVSKSWKRYLRQTQKAPTPQNGQTHSNNSTVAKHTQTIRLLPTNCLIVFDHFVGLALEGFRILIK